MLKTDVKDCALILFASFVFYQLFEGVILNQRTDRSFQSQPWVDDNKQFSKCKTNFPKTSHSAFCLQRKTLAAVS